MESHDILSGATWWISALKEHCRFFFSLLFFRRAAWWGLFLKIFLMSSSEHIHVPGCLLVKKKMLSHRILTPKGNHFFHQATYEISKEFANLTSHILFLQALINMLMLFMHGKKKRLFLFLFSFSFFFLLICSSSKLWPPFQCNKQNPRTPVRSCHHGNTSNSNIGLELICFFHLSGPIVPSVNDWQWQQTLSPTQIMIKKKKPNNSSSDGGKIAQHLIRWSQTRSALFLFNIWYNRLRVR